MITHPIVDIFFFKSAFEGGFTEKFEDYYQTKYERKWKRQNKKIYYMRFDRIKKPDIDEKDYMCSQDLQFSMQQVEKRISNSNLISKETALTY